MLPHAAFNKMSARLSGLTTYCRECVKVKSQGWVSTFDHHGYHIQKKFGITSELYAEMLDLQGGACAICKGLNPSGKRLSIDHCHKTGRVRGLLCVKCNTVLGQADDDVAILMAAIKYLSEGV